MAEPMYERAGISLHLGDCREVLAGLPDGCVQTVVTSPPYFGLRDYGTAEWEGGDPACSHQNGVMASNKSSLHDGHGNYEGEKRAVNGMPYRDTCGKCGARRIDRQIGLEATPAAFVAEMVAVFREVRRVLRDDGTVWLNLGDSYAGSWGNYSGQNRGNGGQREIAVGSLPSPAWDGRELERPAASRKIDGIKPKDLMGIPWRVAFALQGDGWYLRSDIVWAKPNAMPESVTDRPTRSHEYIFLLSKSSSYYYDQDAIAEPITDSTVTRMMQDVEAQAGSERANGGGKTNGNMKSVLKRAGRNSHANVDYVPREHLKQDAIANRTYVGFNERFAARPTRNRRDVWTVAPAQFRDAHFATFPPKLIEPCILAGAPAGGVVLDPFCGAGTTLLVAKNLGRAAIGIELNPAYCELIVNRLRQDVLPLARATDHTNIPISEEV